MCIVAFWRNRTGARRADNMLCTGKYALKTSGGIGQRLDRLIGRAIAGHVRQSLLGNRTVTRIADRALYTGNCVLKSSAGIGQRIQLLVGTVYWGMCVENF